MYINYFRDVDFLGYGLYVQDARLLELTAKDFGIRIGLLLIHFFSVMINGVDGLIGRNGIYGEQENAGVPNTR